MAQPNTVPPGPDVSSAPKLLAITGGLYIVVLIVFGGRMYTRLRPAPHFGWDDYMITFALVLALIEWALFLAAVKYGVGRHNYYVPADKAVIAQHLLFASQLPWTLAMMFVKISIACMLLRIKRTRVWVIFLWGMIGVQIASCIASFVFLLVQCIPLAAIWDPTNHPNAVCVKPQGSYISVYVNSTISITTDLIFALLPISFIRKMQRPFRERVVLACLMGLGLFAAITSIVKTTLVKSFGITGDTLWDAIDISLWSILEEQTGIIAACIPCLKSPFERILGRFGLLSTSKRTTCYYPAGHENYGMGKSHQLSSMRPRNGLRMSGENADAQSEENILPAEEGEKVYKGMGNGRIVKTTEIHFAEEETPTVAMAMAREEDGKVYGADDNREENWQAV